MEGKYAVKLSITELIKLVGNEGNVIMVAYGKCKCGLIPDSSRSQLHVTIFIYSPLELRDSQLFDGDLQPVIHWMEGEAPTQNKVQLHGKTTRILWNWMDRLRMQNVVLNATTLNTQACVLSGPHTAKTRSRRAKYASIFIASWAGLRGEQIPQDRLEASWARRERVLRIKHVWFFGSVLRCFDLVSTSSRPRLVSKLGMQAICGWDETQISHLPMRSGSEVIWYIVQSWIWPILGQKKLRLD